MSDKKLECFKCHQEIVFDSNVKTEGGKQIPLNPETHEPHDCPEYNKSQSGNTGGSKKPEQAKLDEKDPDVEYIDRLHEAEGKIKRRLKQLDMNDPVNEKVGMYLKLLMDRKNR